MTNKKHIDFFQWLNKKENKNIFPIKRNDLEEHYKSYKTQYGSIHNVKDFVNNLSQKTKDNLCKHVTVNGTEIDNIDELIKLIYRVRSNFAHSTKLTLEFTDGFHYGGNKGNRIVWKQFKFEHLLAALEEGIVVHFQRLSK